MGKSNSNWSENAVAANHGIVAITDAVAGDPILEVATLVGDAATCKLSHAICYDGGGVNPGLLWLYDTDATGVGAAVARLLAVVDLSLMAVPGQPATIDLHGAVVRNGYVFGVVNAVGVAINVALFVEKGIFNLYRRSAEG